MLWISFSHGIVPVVMGPPREDYERRVPPNSFIHVDDFNSPEALAAYLRLVGNDPHLYNKYFEWRRHWVLIDTNYYCRLCAMLHSNIPNMWYEDVDDWYRHPELCVKADDENPYASWKIDEKRRGKRPIGSSVKAYTRL